MAKIHNGGKSKYQFCYIENIFDPHPLFFENLIAKIPNDWAFVNQMDKKFVWIINKEN